MLLCFNILYINKKLILLALRIVILVMFLLFSFKGYSFPKFESEQRFYDESLNKEFRAASDLLGDLYINKDLETKIKIGLNKSSDNDYYSNKFNALLFHYYFLIGDTRACYAIFEKEIMRTEIESKISYVFLLSEFYDYFNKVSYTEYTDQILKRIKFIGSELKGYEKLYVESTFLLKKSLSFNKSNIIVSRDLLNESITILEELSTVLPKEDYKVAKTIAYNYLGITYMDHLAANSNNQDDENKLVHAISLFKKSLRFNATKSAYSSFTVYNNLAYANNVKGDYNQALIYTKQMDELLKNADKKVYLFDKMYCNYTDSYNLLLDKTNTEKYYPLCIKGIKEAEILKQDILNLIKENKLNISPEIKISNPHKYRNIAIVVFGLIVIIGLLYLFNKRQSAN